MNTDLVVSLIASIRGAANELITAELKRFGAPGLVPSHGSILDRLYRHGPMPMSRLAEAIGRRKNTVTTLIRKLEQTGFVQRQPDPADCRVCLIALTDRGEAFRENFRAISGILLDKIWGDMPPEEREALIRGLEKLRNNLERE